MNYTLHHGDLPNGLDLGPVVAADCEMTGLNPWRDHLCLMQLAGRDGHAHLVKFKRGEYNAPNTTKLMANPNVVKIFHVGATDLAFIYNYLRVEVRPVFCTKVASRLARTNTDIHSMKQLIKEFLDIDFKKTHQQSDWGADAYSPEQLEYAAADVQHLHVLYDKLSALLEREGRMDLAKGCFDFLPIRARLDLGGWPEEHFLGH
jgi:ribonuclease D